MRTGQKIVNPEWHRIILKKESSTAEEAHIRTLFEWAYNNRSRPAGMSLRVGYDRDRTTIYYLSPAAVTIEPCLIHHLNAVAPLRRRPPHSWPLAARLQSNEIACPKDQAER